MTTTPHFLKTSQATCWKMIQNVAFELKLNCLVTLFDRKLQALKLFNPPEK